LPENALDVLESMKLFFDLEGFVFVAGLDQSVVERAVALKYASSPDQGVGVPISGTEYVKKVFQVPFTLPRITTGALQEYLTSVVANSDLGFEQKEDFEARVRRHIEFLQGEDSVNPREIKRLINAYILQLKTLSPRLPDLDPDLVLALQSLSFRPDWREMYDQLAVDPLLFQSAVRDAVAENQAADTVWLAGTRVALPDSFRRYMRGIGRALLFSPDLEQYVSAAETTRSTDPTVLEAQAFVGRLRRSLEAHSSGTLETPVLLSQLIGGLERLRDVTVRRSAQHGTDLQLHIASLEEAVKKAGSHATEADMSESAAGLEREFAKLLDLIDNDLKLLRRQTTVGPSTA
jgi:hypothetical protein